MAWYLTQDLYPIQDDPGNNRRLYRTDVWLNASGYNAYSGYNTSGGGSVNGYGFSFGGPSDVSLNNSRTVVCTFDIWIYGDANGYNGGVGADSWFNGGGGWAPGYITASASAGGFDYDRKPDAPSTVTSVLNADKSITVTSNNVNSPAGTATYYVAYSSNGGSTWSAYTTIPGNARVYTFNLGSLPMGVNYRFRMYASNSDGSSAATAQSTDLFLPAGGRRFDGSSFVATLTAKRYDGSNWNTLTTAKRYDGSNWVNLT